MFEQAVAAGLPLVGVSTDDTINAEVVIKKLVGELGAYKSGVTTPGYPVMLHLGSTNIEPADVLYRKFMKWQKTLVLVNPEPSPLIFDAGTLPVPEDLMVKTMESQGYPGPWPELMAALRGLSLRSATETVLLAQATYGEFTPRAVRDMRNRLSPNGSGLTPVDVGFDYYDAPGDLEDWLTTMKPYFVNADVPNKLVPRGMLLDGEPGTGKTMAAKYVAGCWGVPLYRFDVSQVLSKYIGESEAKMARLLTAADRESPCVLLIDEVEKLFGGEDHGAVTRVFSQLLWWMAEHNSRVFTVLTCNHLEKLPHELYRPGRVDRSMTILGLTIVEAKAFVMRVLNTVMPATDGQRKLLWDQVSKVFSGSNTKRISQARLTAEVYTTVRAQGWAQPTA